MLSSTVLLPAPVRNQLTVFQSRLWGGEKPEVHSTLAVSPFGLNDVDAKQVIKPAGRVMSVGSSDLPLHKPAGPHTSVTGSSPVAKRGKKIRQCKRAQRKRQTRMSTFLPG